MYLDPGFGGMLVQIIIAIVAGGGALLFAFRRKISAYFSKKKNPAPGEAVKTDLTVSEDDMIDTMAGPPENEDKKE